MKLSAASVGILIVGLGFVGESMAATPPSSCNTPRLRRGFHAGVASGHSLVQMSWNAVNDCDRLEDFADIVMNNIDSVSIPPESSDYVICRVEGIMQGAEEEVDAVWKQCEGDCAQEGRLIAQIGGRLYCELSIRLNGLALADDILRRPVRTCGVFFQVACDSEFLGFTQRYSNPSGRCYPYTVGPFEPVFRQARHNQCVYEPAP